MPGLWDYGYSSDVLEHIPPEDVDKVVIHMAAACRKLFCVISLEEDTLGELVGEPLHLSVHSYEWWRETFERCACTVIWSKDIDTHAVFYVTCYATAKDFQAACGINVTEDEIEANVRENMAAGIPRRGPTRNRSASASSSRAGRA